MKKHFLLATAGLLMAFSFMSCSKMKPLVQEYFKVQPAVLEAKGGVVEASITGTFPEKYFKKKATMTITPVLKYNGTEERLDAITFQGEGVKGNDKEVSNAKGGTFTHKVSFEFKPGMEKSELYLQFEVKEGDKSTSLPEVKVADGIQCTYMLAKAENMEPAFAADGFQHSITNQQEADINFLINQADIRSSELKAEDIVELTNKLKEISASERTNVTGVEISGYASPEGGLDLNTNLAEKREKVAVSYINNQMSKLKTQAQVDSKYTAEDWDGFQQLVSNSSIQDKELILSVLAQFSDPEQRETEIRKLSAAFKVLADEILPQLRRSKMKVSYELTGKTDDQLTEMAVNAADSLSVEELLYAATLVKDLNTKEKIYLKAAQLYPSDWRTINNLGAVKYLKGEMDNAEKLFSKAIDMKSSAKETNFNWGLIQLGKGDIKVAGNFLGKCSGLGAKLDAALGVIYLHKGDYFAANKALAEDKSNNAVIAKLAKNDVAGATTKAKEVKAANELTSYLKAIIAARSGDKESVFSNLKDAVKDPALKQRAAVDIEFAKYNTEAAFAEIIK